MKPNCSKLDLCFPLEYLTVVFQTLIVAIKLNDYMVNNKIQEEGVSTFLYGTSNEIRSNLKGLILFEKKKQMESKIKISEILYKFFL